MLALMNIRVKYLKRNPCLLFWSYLFLPGLILFFIFTKKKKYSFPLKHIKYPPIPSGEDLFFDKLVNGEKSKRTYESLLSFLPNTSIIINDDSYCDKIVNFTLEETRIKVNCSYFMNNFTNDTTHIIKIMKIEDKFKISLIERQIDENTKIMLQISNSDQDKITDLFYLNNITHNESNYNNFEEARFKRFWELESFLSKLLIFLNNKEANSDFKMSLGFNSYPEHYRFTDYNTYSFYSTVSFIIALQFSIIGYNFNMRMIDEKENKLFILLERQGISKMDYFISWLFTYYTVFSFSIIAFTKYLFYYISFRYILILINILLYSFSILQPAIFSQPA